MKNLLALLGLTIVTAGSGTSVSAPAQGDLERLGLRSGARQELELVAMPDGATRTKVLMRGAEWTLELAPHSVRAPGFRLLVQDDASGLVEATPGPVRTVRGTILETEGAQVAGSLDETGLTATVRFADGSLHWIEPVVDRIRGARFGDHVVYSAADVLPTPGSCGNPVEPHEHPDPPQDELGGGVNIERAQLACDADFEFFTTWGSSVATVQQRVEVVLNAVNLQYENEALITHQLTALIVRTSETDPYNSTNSDDLLCEFITEWTNNQQGIVYDVAHLFTGKSIDGSTIGQAASFGEICERQGVCNTPPTFDVGAYCYSSERGNFGCQTDLMAHELGHLWSATHCDCLGFTMHPMIQCANTFTFQTRLTIVTYRNTLMCLDELFPDVWVNFAYAGPETGTQLEPFDTLAEGLDKVNPEGTVHVVAGSSSETAVIDQRVTLVAEGGSAVIGQ